MPIWPTPRLAAFAAALPFEHLLRKRTAAEAMQRWRIEAETQRLVPGPVRVALLLSAAGEWDRARLTLASWELQTWPRAAWLLSAADGEPWRAQREAAGFKPPLAVAEGFDAAMLRELGVDWVVPAVPGDILHPSLAGIIGIHASARPAAVAWDWLTADIGAGGVKVVARHRGAFRDRVADLTRDCRGRAFAVPADIWQGHPGRDDWAVRMAVEEYGNMEVHPEPLGIYPAHAQQPLSGVAHVAARLWKAPFVDDGAGLPLPARPANHVSVIVLYRDRPELTTRALDSVLSQRLPGKLEVVLVDNDSNEATRAAIERYLSKVPSTIGVRRIAYPHPFNHSRQCNLAAEAALGDVLVFLNNDARLMNADALDRLSRWALLPGVATVGACIVDEEGRATGGGFRSRRNPGAEYNSPVEEAAGVMAELPREVVGNTFACAAVGASAFRQLGRLDEVRFPIGYNDVDFCLRATQRGWTHVNLAGIRVSHTVGASRARADEIFQKLILRRAHPWLSTRALQEIEQERLDLPVVPIPGIGQ